MEGFPDGKVGLCVYKGLARTSVSSPIAAEVQALCAEPIAAWRSGGGGHGCGCGGWLGSILAKIQEKAGELDSLLLLMIRIAEAGRPGHRLRLLPLRNTRLAIGFKVAKFLQELEEVITK